MIDQLLKIVAPHYCYGCRKAGSTLCSNCKYNIISEPFSGCIVCQKPAGERGVCGACSPSFERAWCVSERTDVVQAVLDGYKFERQRSSYKALGALLDDHVSDFSHEPVVVVPIPTVARHIRIRGYDHTMLIARRFARLRNAPLDTRLLTRKTSAAQLGANRKKRIAQAKAAFHVRGIVSETSVYLLIDDLTTTGSPLAYAARALKGAGASRVWVAVIARQPLDK